MVGDNFWVWRADHGDNVAWEKNEAENGIIINGDDVTMYALMVEHFEQYQTVWNGDHGKVYMYQSEIPYDVPNQEVWMSHEGQKNGYASFYVDDAVDTFEAWGLGVYLYNRDASVELDTAMEVPDKKPYLTVSFDAPLFGLWSPAGMGAPFICIEPWYGRCDRAGFAGELKDREYGNSLAQGEKFEKSYTIAIEM